MVVEIKGDVRRLMVFITVRNVLSGVYASYLLKAVFITAGLAMAQSVQRPMPRSLSQVPLQIDTHVRITWSRPSATFLSPVELRCTFRKYVVSLIGTTPLHCDRPLEILNEALSERDFVPCCCTVA